MTPLRAPPRYDPPHLSKVTPLAATSTVGPPAACLYSHSSMTGSSQEPRATAMNASMRCAAIHVRSCAVTFTPRGHSMSRAAWQQRDFCARPRMAPPPRWPRGRLAPAGGTSPPARSSTRVVGERAPDDLNSSNLYARCLANVFGME
ncbi:hypothetical protein MSG28_009962 [Choristoneura fumiferana]|uniref:Uncharacterized protein n=1 Tax=Choristoneura fumiferana TaxID=7141 RepID=A0ACC0JD97_CHOFU|nr:hypothetical protein MSG28_009962 [Choristoneura fumiferana]